MVGTEGDLGNLKQWFWVFIAFETPVELAFYDCWVKLCEFSFFGTKQQKMNDSEFVF